MGISGRRCKVFQNFNLIYEVNFENNTSIREIAQNFHNFLPEIYPAAFRVFSYIAFAQIFPLLLPEFREKAMGNSGKSNGKFGQKQWENLGKSNEKTRKAAA